MAQSPRVRSTADLDTFRAEVQRLVDANVDAFRWDLQYAAREHAEVLAGTPLAAADTMAIGFYFMDDRRRNGPEDAIYALMTNPAVAPRRLVLDQLYHCQTETMVRAFMESRLWGTIEELRVNEQEDGMWCDLLAWGPPKTTVHTLESPYWRTIMAGGKFPAVTTLKMRRVPTVEDLEELVVAGEAPALRALEVHGAGLDAVGRLADILRSDTLRRIETVELYLARVDRMNDDTENQLAADCRRVLRAAAARPAECSLARVRVAVPDFRRLAVIQAAARYVCAGALQFQPSE